MGKPASTAAGKHNTDRRSRQEPRQSFDVAALALAQMMMAAVKIASQFDMTGHAARHTTRVDEKQFGRSPHIALEEAPLKGM